MITPCDAVRHALHVHTTKDLGALGHTATCSGAHALAWGPNGTIVDEVEGYAQLMPNTRYMQEHTQPVFDLASVTKSLVTATLAMRAISKGWIDWSTPVVEVFPRWGAVEPDNGATLLHLLNHSSGLPAWHKFYLDCDFDLDAVGFAQQRAQIVDSVLTWPRHPVPGEVYAYSDLGYIALCALLEAVYATHTGMQRALDVIAQDVIFGPLEMHDTCFVSALRGHPPITEAIATEWCDHRQRVVVGEVHDENTFVMGGVSGHAGAFSTAHDLLRFARHMLEIDQGTARNGLVSQEVLHRAWSPQSMAPGGHHVAGWDTPSGESTSVGRGADRANTVGHLGFTGTSLWIDRARQEVVILLTNRVHPTRENPRIFSMRVDVHEAIWPPQNA